MNTIWFPDLSQARGPKYRVLTEAIRSAVADGALAEGEKLPPVREIAWQLKVTPGTVARAYGLLTDAGVLEAQVGRGTFVAGNAEPKVIDGPLIYPIERAYADFRGCHVSDVGQGRIVQKIMEQLSQRTHGSYIDYPTAIEDQPCRVAVCDWVGTDHVGPVTADDVVLGYGAQNCVIMALQALLHGATPVILTEELAYPGVRHAARLLRAKLVGLAMDNEGIRPDALERAYRQHGGQVLVTSAEVHSPTTIRTSLRRKQEIAALARRYNLPIIEDDCHRICPTDIPAYRAMLPEQGWYVSSLTKGVSSALRFGFTVAPKLQAPVARQAAQSSFYGMSQPVLDVANELLKSGQAASIRREVVKQLTAQIQVAVNALGRWDITWRPDAPFIWLRLPRGWRASSFAVACEKAGVRLKSADEFALPDGSAPNAVRLAINTCMPQEQFLTALETINGLLANPPIDFEA